jgi:hypothetical protein
LQKLRLKERSSCCSPAPDKRSRRRSHGSLADDRRAYQTLDNATTLNGAQRDPAIEKLERAARIELATFSLGS